MRKVCFLFLFLMTAAGLCSAQTGTDRRTEIFVGYSNLQAEGIPSQEQNQNNSFDDKVFGERTGLHGVNASVAGYVTPRVAIVGDFSFHQRSRNFTAGSNVSGDVDTRVFQFLGGPHLRFPNTSRVTPFVHALFGVANTRFEVEQNQTLSTGTQTLSFETSSTDFAMALGGGLDVRASDNVSIRLIQFDYNPVFLRDRSVQVLGAAGAITPQTLEGQRQDNLRLSVGAVFK